MSLAGFDKEKVLSELYELSKEPVNIMEVCGTHTMSIAKAGIKRMLPGNIRLISGPGCPVCVTPPEVIDAFLKLSEDDNIIIVTYGDMLKVPGSVRGDNLARRRALGSHVEIVFSPMDALAIAKANPQKEAVFLAAGFETTAPGTAAAIGSAAEEGIGNVSFLTMLKTVEPAVRALAKAPDFNVKGLLCPGHVAVIIGEEGFSFVPDELALAASIAGFEPEDIMLAVLSLLRQLNTKKLFVDNQYKRAVRPGGNPIARAVCGKYLIPSDEIWRGLGVIEKSGLSIRPEYEKFDAKEKFGIEYKPCAVPSPCRCGDVICGRLEPKDCPMFGKACLPEEPVGPCMVSSEGACAAAYKYGEY